MPRLTLSLLLFALHTTWTIAHQRFACSCVYHGRGPVASEIGGCADAKANLTQLCQQMCSPQYEGETVHCSDAGRIPGTCGPGYNTCLQWGISQLMKMNCSNAYYSDCNCESKDPTFPATGRIHACTTWIRRILQGRIPTIHFIQTWL